MSANPFDEACPMCDADVTFGKAHQSDGTNKCPDCGSVWDREDGHPVDNANKWIITVHLGDTGAEMACPQAVFGRFRNQEEAEGLANLIQKHGERLSDYHRQNLLVVANEIEKPPSVMIDDDRAAINVVALIRDLWPDYVEEAEGYAEAIDPDAQDMNGNKIELPAEILERLNAL